MASFVVGLSGAVSPGPLLAVAIVHSAKKGYMVGPWVSLGHSLVEAVLVLALVLGLAPILGSKEAGAVVGVVGGVMLILIGVGVVRESRGASLSDLMKDRRVKIGSSTLLAGIIATVSNPFFFIWWVTIGNAMLLQGIKIAQLVGVLVFYFFHISSDFAWYSLVSVSIYKGRGLMSDVTYRRMLMIVACFLLILGLFFMIEGGRLLMTQGT
jgi:threonine/homoserine/homoserine lactone efflux protein